MRKFVGGLCLIGFLGGCGSYQSVWRDPNAGGLYCDSGRIGVTSVSDVSTYYPPGPNQPAGCPNAR